MRSRFHSSLRLIEFLAVVWLGTFAALAQNSIPEFHKILRETAAFNENDFAALEQGQTVVRLLPVMDKKEVAVSGLVSLKVPADLFLQSFRESMTQKSNAAILEIGRFSHTPTIADLQTLTFEDRDIEDLKECVVGNCKIKLSAPMIERLHQDVDWEAPDYHSQATQLLKRMLVDYVRAYLARGDSALIAYHDKADEVRLAEEQQLLMAAPSYLSRVLAEFRQQLKGTTKPQIFLVEDAIVWSKIMFGLKPVIAINHVMVYRHAQESGPQILVASKQIYANHYFDSSLALTAFVNIPGADLGSCLVYENRSRTDGLGGMFSKMKRGIVEDKAVASLKTVLESSRESLNARMLSGTESSSPSHPARTWRGRRISRVQLFLLLSLITAFVALFALGNYSWKSSLSGEAHR
ncbi:MAG TPA: hypothetical protein VGN86_17510 [Pyrinomonadaceae bacterium]|jgi:hypothetical protein|nr:hypothetical protein [Pyrinomonadaceae bacterium]